MKIVVTDIEEYKKRKLNKITEKKSQDYKITEEFCELIKRHLSGEIYIYESNGWIFRYYDVKNPADKKVFDYSGRFNRIQILPSYQEIENNKKIIETVIDLDKNIFVYEWIYSPDIFPMPFEKVEFVKEYTFPDIISKENKNKGKLILNLKPANSRWCLYVDGKLYKGIKNEKIIELPYGWHDIHVQLMPKYKIFDMFYKYNERTPNLIEIGKLDYKIEGTSKPDIISIHSGFVDDNGDFIKRKWKQ